MLAIAATAFAIALFTIAAFLIVNQWSQLVDQIPA
jgi:hypothetical protein